MLTLTSAITRWLWLVMRRASPRKRFATQKATGAITNTSIASRHSMLSSTKKSTAESSNWLPTSVTNVATRPNSSLSLLIRLTMRPD